MKTSINTRTALVAAMTTLALGACSNSATDPTTDPSADATALLSVVPAGGSVGVSVGTTVTVTFNHALATGMEEYAALHEGTVTGPEVAGEWIMSTDHTQLVFTPAEALKPATTYTIHIGGGMMDESGGDVDLEEYGMGIGGAWCTQTMMTQGGMGGMMGGGSMGQYMGTGWADPGNNGTYGMVFTFTTAS